MTETYLIYAIGFLAQLLFGSRMIIQWVQSERAGKIESPVIFWQISLFASFLFMIYGLLRYDSVIIFGQLLSYYIYIRNLQLKDFWKKFPFTLRWLFLITPSLTIILTLITNHSIRTQIQLRNDFTEFMVIAGTVGQLVLNVRFLYQWFYSEKFHESLLPKGFWVLSMVGSILVIVYAVNRFDPVLIVAQALGLIVYLRNFYIAKKSNVNESVF